jgi:predicted metalloprotease with PDZ domain
MAEPKREKSVSIREKTKQKGVCLMKNQIKRVVLFVLVFCVSFSFLPAQQKFYVDLNDRSENVFKVTLIPEKLSEKNKIYQFASTAPGTYQTMDMGKYVKSFKAFDKDGKEIETKHISINQWEIDDPAKTAKIVYSISDTWNTRVKENPVYQMCGSNIEKDNVLLNGQCVFGYFDGMQKTPIKIKLEYPNDWLVGSAMTQDANGFYDAVDYDYVVDSPILLGKLTKATTKIENTYIDVYTYSKTGIINSEQMLILLDDVISATSQFTQGLPVNRYTFLFHFENMTVGAWEHNYSSEYVFNESPLEGQYVKEIKSIAAHEFYHIVTPLNIHSELVGNFNFAKPTMSQHIWFYEGITEWASRMLQVRDYLMPFDEFLQDTRAKLLMNDNFSRNLSLTELSKRSTELQDQYINIYHRGAIVGYLLDIRLLELSKGKMGLREVINQLYKDYGVNKAFSEDGFFDEFVKRTYPEIADFINKYIKGTEKLPVEEYFTKIGVEYKELAGIDSSKISLGFGISLKDNFLVVSAVDNPACGLEPSDKILKLNDEEVNLQNIQVKGAFIQKLKVGNSVKVTVERKGEVKDVVVVMQPRSIKHQFKISENPTEQQLALRNIWLKNL